MSARWRARTVGLAIVLSAGGLAGAAWSVTSAQPRAALAVTDARGTELARLPLDDESDGAFALRYRNSLYGSLVEERYVASADGRIRLLELAADERAVLEEYYAVAEGAQRASASDTRTWTASPAQRVDLLRLDVAASDLSERTLVVPGLDPLELWRLVPDGDSIVMLAVVEP